MLVLLPLLPLLLRLPPPLRRRRRRKRKRRRTLICPEAVSSEMMTTTGKQFTLTDKDSPNVCFDHTQVNHGTNPHIVRVTGSLIAPSSREEKNTSE